MSDNPFEGPYDGTFHILQETGVGPGYTIGGIDDLRKIGSSDRLRALMITKANQNDTWLIKRRATVTLEEILDALPPNMLFGSIAWMVLEGDTEPTTAIIYAGLDIRGLKTLTYARLWTSFRGGKEAYNLIKKYTAETNLDREILMDPIPVSPLVGRDENDEKGPRGIKELKKDQAKRE